MITHDMHLMLEYTNRAISALNRVSADTAIFRYFAEKAENGMFEQVEDL